MILIALKRGSGDPYKSIYALLAELDGAYQACTGGILENVTGAESS